MSTIDKRSVSLSAEQGRFIDDLVAAGGYASASEVVRAGLRALQEREAAVDRWLREEVVPVYDAMKADPSRGVSIDEVGEMITGWHAERVKAGRAASG